MLTFPPGAPVQILPYVSPKTIGPRIASKFQPVTGRVAPYRMLGGRTAPMSSTMVVTDMFKAVAFGLSDDQRFVTEQAKAILDDGRWKEWNHHPL